ncbi:MAG: SNF2-related protein [Nannocystaceae bacterium]
MPSHPIRRRYLAEELVRLRRADDQPRYVASQRAGRIDPNPHQIDAVIFALQRIPQGGCILADEVGLGKTIEAGLVIAQRRAEGARRVLLITPKPLLGQWADELLTLFGIETTEVGPDTDLRVPGVFLIGREQAGGERGSDRLLHAAPFDLCVIDEAHEIFAGLYKRYDRYGRWRQRGRQARMAARVKRALTSTPVLLLTATPIQNSLTELWGLVQYVEPTGTLLGDLPTFRSLFCAGDDRQLREGQDEELRRRVASVCQRTLRRQAQAFMTRPFVERRARLFEYSMDPQERSLYDEVTQYLLEPDLCAFRGGQRRLLLLGFHRRMASSLEALAASLETVAERLRGMLLPAVGRGPRRDDETLSLFAAAAPPPERDDGLRSFQADLEDDESDEPEPESDAELHDDPDESPTGSPAQAAALVPAEALPDTKIRRELARVEDFIARARSCPTDAKLEQLVVALRMALARPEGSGKAVIFTESLATQEYLRQRLVAAQVVTNEEITLFRGTNTGPRVQQALERWTAEVGEAAPGTPASRSVAVRLALVHEFATRSRVLISTEAGAKGLNLQFCDTVMNYDLPWNPQRIEQRIGRCHRYGQTRGVTVINFLNRDNAAQRLTFEILSRKLDLFGTVLDASDVVLHEPGAIGPETLAGALGLDLEGQLQRIYERARSLEEVEAELAALRDDMSDKRHEFEDTYRRTAGLIESRLDETVHGSFAHLADGLAGGLQAFDESLAGLLQRYLGALGAEWTVEDDGAVRRFTIEAHRQLPEGFRDGAVVQVGPRATDSRGDRVDRLHLGHALVRAAVHEARAATARPFVVEVDPCEHPGLAAHRGARGRLVLLKIAYEGFEPAETLRPVALMEDGSLLSVDAAEHLLRHSGLVDLVTLPEPLRLPPDDLEDAIEEHAFLDRAAVEPHERGRLQEALDRIERHMDDRVMIWEQRRDELTARVELARGRRDAAAGAAARERAEAELRAVEEERDAATAEIARLYARDDEDYETWRLGALQRRYNVPRIARILDVELVIQ